MRSITTFYIRVMDRRLIALNVTFVPMTLPFRSFHCCLCTRSLAERQYSQFVLCYEKKRSSPKLQPVVRKVENINTYKSRVQLHDVVHFTCWYLYFSRPSARIHVPA
jgi:hypothetical protein